MIPSQGQPLTTWLTAEFEGSCHTFGLLSHGYLVNSVSVKV